MPLTPEVKRKPIAATQTQQDGATATLTGKFGTLTIAEAKAVAEAYKQYEDTKAKDTETAKKLADAKWHLKCRNFGEGDLAKLSSNAIVAISNRMVNDSTDFSKARREFETRPDLELDSVELGQAERNTYIRIYRDGARDDIPAIFKIEAKAVVWNRKNQVYLNIHDRNTI